MGVGSVIRMALLALPHGVRRRGHTGTHARTHRLERLELLRGRPDGGDDLGQALAALLGRRQVVLLLPQRRVEAGPRPRLHVAGGAAEEAAAAAGVDAGGPPEPAAGPAGGGGASEQHGLIDWGGVGGCLGVGFNQSIDSMRLFGRGLLAGCLLHAAYEVWSSVDK